MSWYYLLKKDEHYVLAVYNNLEQFMRYGFHKVFGFGGNRNHVEFHAIKALWYDDILHKKRKDARLWRIALGINKQFDKELATHNELLKRQALERKKKRIFPKEGMQILRKDIKWLACEKCKRMYDYASAHTETRHECSVKGNRKIWAIDLACGSGRGCNDEEGKQWVLTRLRTTGKRNPSKSDMMYTIKYGQYILYWQ